MKRTLALLLALAFAAAAHAQVSAADHAAHHPPETTQAMDQRLQEMQALMESIGKSRNSAERARLLEQHAKAMRDSIQTLRHVDDACVMNMGMGPGPGQGMGPGQPQAQGMRKEQPGAMMACHEMMKGRMGMLTGLIEQMLLHDAAEHATRK